MSQLTSQGVPDGDQAKPPETQSPKQEPPPEPAGWLTVLLLEAYFLILGVLTAYALWSIWPYRDAGNVTLFGVLIDFRGDTDARLLLVALLSGLLGAVAHVTTSFTDYLGNRKFASSWVPWYALRPLIGLVLGLLFFLIVRAGIVTSNGADAVNPFGVAAVSGLAGLFSKQTTDKLRDVFENAFPVGKGGDKSRRDKLKNDDAGADKDKENTGAASTSRSDS